MSIHSIIQNIPLNYKKNKKKIHRNQPPKLIIHILQNLVSIPNTQFHENCPPTAISKYTEMKPYATRRQTKSKSNNP